MSFQHAERLHLHLQISYKYKYLIQKSRATESINLDDFLLLSHTNMIMHFGQHRKKNQTDQTIVAFLKDNNDLIK